MLISKQPIFITPLGFVCTKQESQNDIWETYLHVYMYIQVLGAILSVGWCI